MPRVSIVLPTYNGEKYLRESIESIINQTYQDWELIIVNDCSIDNTREIALKYVEQDNRIMLINNDINQKLPQSLNIGFGKSSGKLLTWTSDDNRMKSCMLETMVQYFQEDKKLDFLYGDIIPIDCKGRIMTQCGYINGEIDDIYVRNPISACFMYKRKVYQHIGEYNRKAFSAEDYEYWIRIYEAGFKMLHIKEKLYYYRIHEGSLTATKKRENALLNLELLNKNLNKETRENQKMKIKKKISDIQYQIENGNREKSPLEWEREIHDTSMKWLMLKTENKNLKIYFEKHRYSTVAIYGCKQLAECLYKELENTGIKVLYGVDRDKYGVYTESFKVFQPDDLLEAVDVLVVTALSHYEEIRKDMISRINCPIVSLKEIIEEVY